MKTYSGGNKAPSGMYLNLKTGEFTHLGRIKPNLPGTDLNRFARVPGWLPFLAGPVIGLAFVIFLPFAGLVGLTSGALIKGRVLQGIGRQFGRKPAPVVK
jgi:hypothetical protein